MKYMIVGYLHCSFIICKQLYWNKNLDFQLFQQSCNQTSQATVKAILLCSNSDELLATVFCFFDFQSIRELPSSPNN